MGSKIQTSMIVITDIVFLKRSIYVNKLWNVNMKHLVKIVDLRYRLYILLIVLGLSFDSFICCHVFSPGCNHSAVRTVGCMFMYNGMYDVAHRISWWFSSVAMFSLGYPEFATRSINCYSSALLLSVMFIFFFFMLLLLCSGIELCRHGLAVVSVYVSVLLSAVCCGRSFRYAPYSFPCPVLRIRCHYVLVVYSCVCVCCRVVCA